MSVNCYFRFFFLSIWFLCVDVLDTLQDTSMSRCLTVGFSGSCVPITSRVSSSWARTWCDSVIQTMTVFKSKQQCYWFLQPRGINAPQPKGRGRLLIYCAAVFFCTTTQGCSCIWSLKDQYNISIMKMFIHLCYSSFKLIVQFVEESCKRSWNLKDIKSFLNICFSLLS